MKEGGEVVPVKVGGLDRNLPRFQQADDVFRADVDHGGIAADDTHQALQDVEFLQGRRRPALFLHGLPVTSDLCREAAVPSGEEEVASIDLPADGPQAPG